MLAARTDYLTDTGDPEPNVRLIAAAGFSHLHWGHQSMADYIYDRAEIDQIARWLAELDLKLLDTHGAVGPAKCWYSPREDERLAGADMVRNRLAMTADLAGGVVIMHVPAPDDSQRWRHMRRSLDELQADIQSTGVRIALENGPMAAIAETLADYPPDRVGLCYDSGHGNLPAADGLTHLADMADRLIAVHLHDNDGTGDQHLTPFKANIDWPRLAELIAGSAYDKPLSLELAMGPQEDQAAVLAHAFQAGMRLTEMVDQRRG